MSPKVRRPKRPKVDSGKSEEKPRIFEVGVARSVKGENVVTVFTVNVVRGRDGKRRTVIFARRRAFEDENVRIVDEDRKRTSVYGTKVRFRVPNARLTDLRDLKDLKTMTVAELVAGLLEAGLIQVDIEGPSAYKFDGNPLTGYANAIITSLDRVFRMNVNEGIISPRGTVIEPPETENEDEEAEEEEEEEAEETESEDEAEEEEKPKKKPKKRKRE